jgi:hypothetical protein
VQFFDGRQVRRARIGFVRQAYSSVTGEVADAEARDKHKHGDERIDLHMASFARVLATPGRRLSTVTACLALRKLRFSVDAASGNVGFRAAVESSVHAMLKFREF